MDKVYNYRQYPYNVYIYLSNTKVHFYCTKSGNIKENLRFLPITLSKDACIIYNKKKEILSWGDAGFEANTENHIRVDDFQKSLYLAFLQIKTGKSKKWSFFLYALSDYLRLLVKELEIIVTKEYSYINCEKFQYLLVVPSEWEKEIRDLLIRPIFTSTGLISENDHPNRILFVSEVESIAYQLQDYEGKHFFKRRQNTILCRLSPIACNTILIKLDLISTINHLFNIPDSMLFPRILKSNSITITSEDIRNSIKKLLRAKLFSSCEDYNIQVMTEDIYSSEISYTNSDELIINRIMERNDWELDVLQKKVIRSIHRSEIFDEICEPLYKKMKDIVSYKLVAKYTVFKIEDLYSSDVETDKYLSYWVISILEYNMASLNFISTLYEADIWCISFEPVNIFSGAGKVILEARQNADMYCQPYILPNEDLATSPSIFLNSKPDVIINIDISLKSTMISYLLLNDKELLKDACEFNADSSLPSLGGFFDISNTTILNIRNEFILLSEKCWVNDSFIDNIFSELQTDMSKIEDILLNKEYHVTQISLPTEKKVPTEAYFRVYKTYTRNYKSNEDCLNTLELITVNQRKYFQLFLLIYMIYIKEIISTKISLHLKHGRKDTRIGYAVSIEKKLLNNVIGTKENLRELIYTSELVEKDNSSKKLRIVTQGEGCLPIVKNSCNLTFPLRAYFVLAQLHEDYIQLTLNQIVTDYNLEEEQEAIIVEDKIFSTANIYDSLCLSMWNNLMEENSLIESCDIHNKGNKNNIIELFSLENKKVFTINLERFISNKILNANAIDQSTRVNKIPLSNSCVCKVNLTFDNIIDISFIPLLKDIASTMSTSLKSKEYFGNYPDVEYVFALVHFNNNVQLLDILEILLKEEMENFKREKEIEISFFLIKELPTIFSRTAFKQRSNLYNAFQVGTLYPVYSQNYGVNIGFHNSRISFKKKKGLTKSIELGNNRCMLLVKKGDIISDLQLKVQLYFDFKLEPDETEKIIAYGTADFFEELNRDKPIPLNESFKFIDSKVWHLKSNGFKSGINVPVVFSIDLKRYSSSIHFSERIAGEAYVDKNISQIGELLTLRRF